MAFINYVTREVTVTIQGRSGEMHPSLPWYEDPDDNSRMIYERVPLNSTFVDNGVYLTYTDRDGTVTDITHQVERYGHVNTAKAGEYVLKYFCEYKTWSRIYDYEEGESILDYRKKEPVADFRWKKFRRVVVYEPEWLMNLVPQAHQALYPMINQQVQRYQDIYWELNYHADNVRLGTKVSSVAVPKHKNGWKVPIGRIYRYGGDNNLWYVYGYTFNPGDKVEVDFTGKNNFFGNPVLSNLIVFKQQQETLWAVDHTHVHSNYRLEKNCYKVGSWVQFLDKIYVCHKDHAIVQDKHSKINPKIIYPTNEEYWVSGCRVELAKNEYDAASLTQRKINTDITGAELDYVKKPAAIRKYRDGYAIRYVDAIVESQGFLYRYTYEPGLAVLHAVVSAVPPFITLYVEDEDIPQPYCTSLSWKTENLTSAKLIWDKDAISPSANRRARLALIPHDSSYPIEINIEDGFYEIPKEYLSGKNSYITYQIQCSENAPFETKWEGRDNSEEYPDHMESSVSFDIIGSSMYNPLNETDSVIVDIRLPKVKINEFHVPKLSEVHVSFEDPLESSKCYLPITWHVENASKVRFELYKVDSESMVDGVLQTNKTLIKSVTSEDFIATALLKDGVLNLDISELEVGEYAYVLIAERKAYNLKEEREVRFIKDIKYEVTVESTGESFYHNDGKKVIVRPEHKEGHDFKFWKFRMPETEEDETIKLPGYAEEKDPNPCAFIMPPYPVQLIPEFSPKTFSMLILAVREDREEGDDSNCPVTYNETERIVDFPRTLPVTYGEQVTLECDIHENCYYEIEGWYDENDVCLSSTEVYSVIVTHDLNLTVLYKKKTVEVNFRVYHTYDDEKGEFLTDEYYSDSAIILINSKIPEPTVPALDGFVGMWWYRWIAPPSEWNDYDSYKKGTIIKSHTRKYYKSNTDGNEEAPGTANWSLLSTVYDARINEWDPETSYASDDMVYVKEEEFFYYKALKDNWYSYPGMPSNNWELTTEPAPPSPWNFEDNVLENITLILQWRPIQYSLTLMYYIKGDMREITLGERVFDESGEEISFIPDIYRECSKIASFEELINDADAIGDIEESDEEEPEGLQNRLHHEFAGWYVSHEDTDRKLLLQARDLKFIEDTPDAEDASQIKVEMTPELEDLLRDGKLVPFYVAAKYIPVKYKINFIYGLDALETRAGIETVDIETLTIEKDIHNPITYKDLPNIDSTSRNGCKSRWYTLDDEGEAIPANLEKAGTAEENTGYVVDKDINFYAGYQRFAPSITSIKDSWGFVTASVVTESLKWDLLDLVYDADVEEWHPDTLHATGDIVYIKKEEFLYYCSKVDGNKGFYPEIAIDEWEVTEYLPHPTLYDWSAASTYAEGDVVICPKVIQVEIETEEGTETESKDMFFYYKSKIEDNKGLLPETSPDMWELIAELSDPSIPEWTADTSHDTGTVVICRNKETFLYYKSKIDDNSESPYETTDSWELIAELPPPAIEEWAVDTAYAEGDFVRSNKCAYYISNSDNNTEPPGVIFETVLMQDMVPQKVRNAEPAELIASPVPAWVKIDISDVMESLADPEADPEIEPSLPEMWQEDHAYKNEDIVRWPVYAYYKSLVANNYNNRLTDPTKWELVSELTAKAYIAVDIETETEEGTDLETETEIEPVSIEDFDLKTIYPIDVIVKIVVYDDYYIATREIEPGKIPSDDYRFIRWITQWKPWESADQLYIANQYDNPLKLEEVSKDYTVYAIFAEGYHQVKINNGVSSVSKVYPYINTTFYRSNYDENVNRDPTNYTVNTVNVLIWDPSKSYAKDTVVFSENKYYLALRDMNRNSVLAQWRLLAWETYNIDNILVWDSRKSYMKNAVVLFECYYYWASDDIICSSPYTEDLWRQIVDEEKDSIDNAMEWTPHSTYPQNFVVSFEDGLYWAKPDSIRLYSPYNVEWWRPLNVWDARRDYMPDVVVLWPEIGGNYYRALSKATSSSPYSNTGAILWIKVTEWGHYEDYIVKEIDREGDDEEKEKEYAVVLFEGNFYQALMDEIIHSDISNTDLWRQITVWDYKEDYVIDDVVSYRAEGDAETSYHIATGGIPSTLPGKHPAWQWLSEEEKGESIEAGEIPVFWLSGESYGEGDLIVIGEEMYRATIAIPTNMPGKSDMWNTIQDDDRIQEIEEADDWDNDKSYEKDGVVKVTDEDGDKRYIAKEDVLGTRPTNAEVWRPITDYEDGDGRIDIEIKKWETTKSYVKDAIVSLKPDDAGYESFGPGDGTILYHLSKGGSSSYEPGRGSLWQRLYAWDPSRSYLTGGGAVLYSDNYYKAKKDVPVAVPSQNLADWSTLYEWDEKLSYEKDKAVLVGDACYIAKTAIKSSHPIPDPAPAGNSGRWEKLTGGYTGAPTEAAIPSWEIAKSYERNDLVKITVNRMTNFHHALQAVPDVRPNAGNTTYWSYSTTLEKGKTSKLWVQTQAYATGDIVHMSGGSPITAPADKDKLDGGPYYTALKQAPCVDPNNADSTSYWRKTNVTLWTNTAIYSPGDLAALSNEGVPVVFTYYRAKEAILSSSPLTDKNSQWRLVGQWDPAIEYKKQDVVFYTVVYNNRPQAFYYQAARDTIGGTSPTQRDGWQNVPEWNARQTYTKGAAVIVGATVPVCYIAKEDIATYMPGLNYLWSRIYDLRYTDNFNERYKGDWRSGYEYKRGEIVRVSSIYYEALLDTPDYSTSNPALWVQLNTWEGDNSYKENDVVLYKDSSLETTETQDKAIYYQAKSDIPCYSPSNADMWSELTGAEQEYEGAKETHEWDNCTDYIEAQAVSFNNKYYMTKVPVFHSHPSNKDRWGLITEWDLHESYDAGTMISLEGEYFQARVRVSSSDINGGQWAQISKWSEDTAYAEGQVTFMTSPDVIIHAIADYLWGYTFEGWEINHGVVIPKYEHTYIVDEGGLNNQVEKTDLTRVSFIMPNHDVELTALYTPFQYLLTVGLMRGCAGMGTVTVYLNDNGYIDRDSARPFSHARGVMHDHGTEFCVEAVANEGYMFVGWFNNTDPNNVTYFYHEPVSYFPLHGNLTLAAKFEEIPIETGEV